MPSYKLIYFDLQARGELIRWIFAVAKQPYTDERIQFQDWPALKGSAPFGQLPILEVDGVQLCQSYVIADFLARQFGLTGDTPLEQARVAMVANCVEDAQSPLYATLRETDEARKAATIKKYKEELLPDFLAKFDKFLTLNNGGDGYFIGKKLTYADLTVVNAINEIKSFFRVDVNLDKFPKLAALKARVESDPGLAEWLKNRPSAKGPPCQ